MAGYLVSKGDPFWTFSCGLCGIIGTSAGNDLYHPIQAMLIGAIVPAIAYKLHYFRREAASRSTMRWALSRCMAMADSSAWSLRASCCGEQPSSPYEGFAQVNPLGNFAGACLMFLLGFIPIYIVCKILDSLGLLRVPAKVELEGVDFAHQSRFHGLGPRSGRCREGDDQIEIREERENVDQWTDKLGRRPQGHRRDLSLPGMGGAAGHPRISPSGSAGTFSRRARKVRKLQPIWRQTGVATRPGQRSIATTSRSTNIPTEHEGAGAECRRLSCQRLS